MLSIKTQNLTVEKSDMGTVGYGNFRDETNAILLSFKSCTSMPSMKV